MRFSTFFIAILSALILGLSVLLAMGCGSSDSGSGSGTTSGQEANASQKGESTAEEAKTEESEDEEPADEKSQSGAEPTGKPLTKAQFIKAGDLVCLAVPNDFRSRVTALEEERKAAKEPKAKVAEIARVAAVPPIEAAVVKFKELRPPAGDEQQAQAIVVALGNAAKGLEAEPTGEFQGPKSPFWEFQQLTKKYGFKACSQL